MKTKLCLLILLMTPLLRAGLPGWADKAVAASSQTPIPKNTDVWILHDEIRILARKDGKHRIKRYVLKRILTNYPDPTAGIYAINGDLDTTRIKKLKGWHQPAKGDTEKIDKENALTFGNFSQTIDRSTATEIGFGNLGAGSLVAFESDEINETYFSRYPSFVLSAEPTLCRIYEMEEKGNSKAVLAPINFEAWGLPTTITDNRLELRNLPGLSREPARPDSWDSYPRVLIGFNREDDPLTSWDTLASWYFNRFSQKAWPQRGLNQQALADLEMVQTITQEIRQAITYRQVYMTPSRGWEPNPAAEVQRLSYGDCKDMVSLCGWRLRQNGVAALPVLASVADGLRLKQSGLPQANFNHLILAIPLSTSLGLPAEVEAKGERYLLYDPTAKDIPLGNMHPGYWQREVLICHPEGARWVKVPTASLHQGGLTLDVEGELDPHFTLNGVISMQDATDSWGLRDLITSDNHRAIVWQIRSNLELPSEVVMQTLSAQIQPEGQLALVFQIQWPGFLERDLGGYRLPLSLTGDALIALTKQNKARLNPIELGYNNYTLNITLATQKSLRSEMSRFIHETTDRRFQWHSQFEAGMLKARMSLKNQPVFYGRDKLAEGLDHWEQWRRDFNKFLLLGPVFLE